MRYESKWDYLEHYGVKGQQRGKRRYQNEDGSLTAEGRDHYGVGDPRKGQKQQDKEKQERQRKRRELAKKIGKGVAAAAAVAAIGYGVKKSTDLRDEYRNKAKEESNDWEWRKHRAAAEARKAVGDAKYSRVTAERRGYTKDNPYTKHDKAKREIDFNSGANLHRIAVRYADLSKHYSEIAKSTTRRKAVANYIKNKGKIVLPKLYK